MFEARARRGRIAGAERRHAKQAIATRCASSARPSACTSREKGRRSSELFVATNHFPQRGDMRFPLHITTDMIAHQLKQSRARPDAGIRSC